MVTCHFSFYISKMGIKRSHTASFILITLSMFKLLYLKNKFDIYNSIKKYSLIPLLIVGILPCFDSLIIGLSLLEVALLGNH